MRKKSKSFRKWSLKATSVLLNWFHMVRRWIGYLKPNSFYLNVLRMLLKWRNFDWRKRTCGEYSGRCLLINWSYDLIDRPDTNAIEIWERQISLLVLLFFWLPLTIIGNLIVLRLVFGLLVVDGSLRDILIVLNFVMDFHNLIVLCFHFWFLIVVACRNRDWDRHTWLIFHRAALRFLGRFLAIRWRPICSLVLIFLLLYLLDWLERP